MPERDEMSLRDALTAAMSAEETPVAAVPDGGEQGVSEIPAEGAQGGGIPAEGSPAGAAEPVGETAPAATEAASALNNPGVQPQAPGGMPSHADMWKAFRELVSQNQQLSAALQQERARAQQVLAQQNGAMQQQSQAAEGAIQRQFTPEAAMSKGAAAAEEPPMLNWQELSYLDPAEQQKRVAQWQQAVTDYSVRTAAAQIRDEVAREMAPVRDDWEAKRQIAANEAAKATLFAMPQFADMKEKEGEIEKVIAGTPLLREASPQQKYVLAALISRGIHSSKQPTTEELINQVLANPDVMKALEARRVAEIQRNNEALPKVVPSSGLGNANAVPENKPKNMSDVAKAFMKLY